MKKTQITWFLFAGFLVFFPSVYYLLFDFAIWPVLFALISRSIPLLFSGNAGASLVYLVQCLCWAVILFFLSKVLAKRITASEPKNQLTFTALILLALVLTAYMPIYDVDLVMLSENSDAFKLYKKIFTFY